MRRPVTLRIRRPVDRLEVVPSPVGAEAAILAEEADIAVRREELLVSATRLRKRAEEWLQRAQTYEAAAAE